MHEAIYKAERDLKLAEGASSDHTRLVVARVFSDSPLVMRMLGALAVPEKPAELPYDCRTISIAFEIAPGQKFSFNSGYFGAGEQDNNFLFDAAKQMNKPFRFCGYPSNGQILIVNGKVKGKPGDARFKIYDAKSGDLIQNLIVRPSISEDQVDVEYYQGVDIFGVLK
jgi:hypothetical protein